MATTNNKIEYGIQSIRLWPIIEENGTQIKYAETYIDVPGAVSLKLTALGDATPIYADNGTYMIMTSNEGYEGEWESYQLPIEMQKEILGIIEDANGALIEKSDAKIKDFGMSYMFLGDENNTKIFAPRCTITQRPADEKQTKGESVEAGTNVYAFKMSPRLSDRVVRVKMTADKEAYKTFSDKPYEVKLTETPEV